MNVDGCVEARASLDRLKKESVENRQMDERDERVQVGLHEMNEKLSEQNLFHIQNVHSLRLWCTELLVLAIQKHEHVKYKATSIEHELRICIVGRKKSTRNFTKVEHIKLKSMKCEKSSLKIAHTIKHS